MKVINPKLIGLLLSLSILNLTGCMATMGLMDVTDDAGIGTGKEVTILKDKVIAIGQASKPIAKHENALILVGEKQSYLLENADDDKDKQFLKDIFTQADLSALSIALDKPKLIVKTDKSNCNFNYGCAKVTIKFNKPQAKISTEERYKVQDLGFQCYDYKTNLDCSLSTEIGFTLAQKVANFDNLQHKLKQPVSIEFTQKKTNHIKKGVQKGTFGLLALPAMVVDVVTLPLQLLYYKKDIDKNYIIKKILTKTVLINRRNYANDKSTRFYATTIKSVAIKPK
ncbi:MAG: hypothetical protein KGV51_03240 [Moraxellaceae bacterium]|nr:hypothetical protein [Moraxellaceae bacterium]